MTDDHISESEAEDLGGRLEALFREVAPRQQEFLKTALRLAAADMWAGTSESPSQNSIQDLILDIQQAGAARAISLNPLPIPLDPEGPIT